MSFNLYVKETFKEDYVVIRTLGQREVYVWNSAIRFKSSFIHTHTPAECLTSLCIFQHVPSSLLSSIARTTKANHWDISASRKMITFPNLSLCIHRGFSLQFSKEVQNFELRMYLMRFQINKALQAGKEQKENQENAITIKNGPFRDGEMGGLRIKCIFIV